MNCMLEAYSKVTRIGIHRLAAYMGHDGTEIVRPNDPYPFNMRSFTTSEFHKALHSCGFRFTELIAEHVDISQYLTGKYIYIAYNTRHCEGYVYEPCDLPDIKGIILVDQ